MKRIILSLCCLVALATTALAQESTSEINNEWNWQDRPSSISVTLGAKSLWSVIDGYNNERTFGCYAVRYDYNVLKWLAVGGGVSYEGLNYSRYRYTYDSATGAHASVLDPYTRHTVSLMMELLFTYINREHVQLYSGVSMGLMYEWDGQVGQKSEFQPMLPGWSIIPIGVRAGGKRVYALAEVTLGTQALMNFGVGFHF